MSAHLRPAWAESAPGTVDEGCATAVGHTGIRAVHGVPWRAVESFLRLLCRTQPAKKIDPEEFVKETGLCVAECDADGKDFVDVSRRLCNRMGSRETVSYAQHDKALTRLYSTIQWLQNKNWGTLGDDWGIEREVETRTEDMAGKYGRSIHRLHTPTMLYDKY